MGYTVHTKPPICNPQFADAPWHAHQRDSPALPAQAGLDRIQREEGLRLHCQCCAGTTAKSSGDLETAGKDGQRAAAEASAPDAPVGAVLVGRVGCAR